MGEGCHCFCCPEHATPESRAGMQWFWHPVLHHSTPPSTYCGAHSSTSDGHSLHMLFFTWLRLDGHSLHMLFCTWLSLDSA